MKMIKTLIAASILATATLGAANAMTVDQLSSSTNLNVKVDDGVATLFGTVDNQFESHQAASAAAKIEGVDSVRNLLTFSN